PWLVLDYIDGMHIDEYCQKHQLTSKQIVKLFLNICEALNFVHQRGVVHMDIKANNILINTINNIPYPVIIDFGIANGDFNSDSSDDIFGTVGYSAPEQISGQKVDQRSDVYSLGILLGQLLLKNNDHNIGLLTSQERKLLLQQQKINKNLINIVEKSTQKNPENRYSDMETLRTDLNNYLFDLPLINQQNHIGHILAKTFSRHKVASLLSILVFLSALGFWGKYTADISNQQKQTIHAKNESDELFNFMLTDLFTNLSQIGRIDILKLVTEKSITHLQGQENQILDSQSQFQTAIAFTNAGKVFDALNATDQALSAYEKGISALEKLAHDPLYKKNYLSQLALIKNLKSRTLTAEGQQELTEQNLLESLQVSQDLLKAFPDVDLHEVYESHTQLGWYYMEYENPEKALFHINTAIETAQSMNQRQLSYQWLFNLSQAYQVLSWYQLDYGNPDEAIVTITEAIKLANRTVDENGESIIYFFNQLTLLNQLNYFHLEKNQSQQAQDTVIKAIEIGESLQQKAPKNIEYLRELAYAYSMAGKLNELQQNLNISLDYYQQSLNITEIMNQNDQSNFSTANDYANDLIYVGTIHEKLEQNNQATLLWDKAIEIMTPVHLLEPNNKYYTNTLIIALLKSGMINQAKPLINELKSSGFNDKELDALLIKHKLNIN
ncbi:MAG: protein kinase family protein, partial [Marinicellaceae bacterium]